VFVSGEHILHADLDSFYASVEQRDDPALRGRPVIVGGGVVLAASYEARAFGVRSAMGGGRARQLCPHAVVVRPRFEAYTEASRAVFAVFEDITPLVEGISIDEAFLDVGGLRHLAGTPVEIAVRLRERVRAEVGLPITVGVARTKFLAKVASGIAKPDGLKLVPADGELDFLHPLPVERLWGVGAKTAAKLHERGITTVGEVAELDREWLDAMLGRARSRSAGGAVPSARSGRWDCAGSPRTRSTRRWPRWSRRWPAGCARPSGCAGRSCCGCASATTPAAPARTPYRGRPTARNCCSRRCGARWPR
jgi:DNA polymerase-4